MELVALLIVSLAGLASGSVEAVLHPVGSVQGAIDFVMEVMNNGSRSHYIEQLEEVLSKDNDVVHPWKYGRSPFKLKLRTSQGNCNKGDSSCDALTLLNKPEDAQPFLGLRNQGHLYAPFMAPFDGVLNPGKVVSIKGTAMRFAETVYVYLRSRTSPYFWYVPLCIKIAYSSNETIVDFYHYSDGQISEIENKGKEKLFELGKPFTIEITFQKESFDIAINGKQFKYENVIPYKGATHLEISALASITSISGVVPIKQRGLVSAPASPLVLPIHDLPLSPDKGRIVGIGGDVLPAAQRFEILLQNSPKLDNYTAVPISLSFRFQDGGLMVNHFMNGKWGEGSWHPNTQWFYPGRQKGQPFYMEFHLKKDAFLCVFHGDWSFEYSYKMPLQSATHLAITGDLQLNRITGLNSIRDCALNVLNYNGKMWLGDANCEVNYDLSYARFGNIPSEKNTHLISRSPLV